MEESKYYQPNIKEFRVGFEYERMNGDKWEKAEFGEIDGYRTFARGYENEFEEIATGIRSVRVKLLDSEDIESIIHVNNQDFSTKFKLRNSYENELVFQTYWIEENEFLDEEYIYWDIKYNQIKITHKSKTLFWGKIKNKSELEVLLSQLGIL